MDLLNQNGKWKVKGSQAERARVAYASLEAGRVVYRVDKEKAVADEDCLRPSQGCLKRQSKGNVISNEEAPTILRPL